MTTLLHAPIAVHSKFAVVAPHRPDDLPAYEPTPEDFLHELGRDLGLEGRTTFDIRLDGFLTSEALLRLVRGNQAGRRERGIAQARDLGFALGAEGSGISGPPAGFSAAEEAAYREGHGAGLDEHDRFEQLARDLAWEDFLDECHSGEPAHLTDSDIHPAGCIG